MTIISKIIKNLKAIFESSLNRSCWLLYGNHRTPFTHTHSSIYPRTHLPTHYFFKKIKIKIVIFFSFLANTIFDNFNKLNNFNKANNFNNPNNFNNFSKAYSFYNLNNSNNNLKTGSTSLLCLQPLHLLDWKCTEY